MEDLLNSVKFKLIMNAISLLGFFISVSVLIYKEIQQKKQRRLDVLAAEQQRERLDSLITTTKRLTDGLSTKLLGQFPKYLPDVAALLAGAKSSIRIMAPVCSHGSFTDLSGWNKIKTVIEEKSEEGEKSEKNFDARLIYGSEASMLRITEYYDKMNGDHWSEWKEKNDAQSKIEKFFGRAFGLDKARASLVTPQLYIRGRYLEHMRTCRDVYGAFGRRRSDERLPMYCWIVDIDKEAIFAISTEDERGRFYGIGIKTTDPILIRALSDMYEQFWQANEPKGFKPDILRKAETAFEQALVNLQKAF